MAQTTIELRKLLQTNFVLFDFPYTFDDAIYKAQLEQAIIDFFYDYEIGFETPEMFKRKFKARWNRIIPYYNKMYNTTLLLYNPLRNHSISETLEQLNTSNTTTTSNATVNNTSNSTSSDYPQQPIAGGDYASGASVSTTNTDSDDSITADSESNSNYTKTIEGITGTTYQDLILKQREVIINLTNDIIEEMKKCFILVF